MLKILILIAGIFQIALVTGSLFIPRLLNWKGELSGLSPLIRQMFWTYAGYILVTNLSFGLLSSLSPESLLDGSILATGVSLFIGLYWTARVMIQFFYFDRSSAPKGFIFFWGEVVMVLFFILFSVVYLFAFYFNYTLR